MPEFTDKEILDLDILAVKQIYAYGLQFEELRKGAVDTETAVHIEMIGR